MAKKTSARKQPEPTAPLSPSAKRCLEEAHVYAVVIAAMNRFDMSLDLGADLASKARKGVRQAFTHSMRQFVQEMEGCEHEQPGLSGSPLPSDGGQSQA